VRPPRRPRRRRPVPSLVREIAVQLVDAGYSCVIGQQFGDASLVVKSGNRHAVFRVEGHGDVRFEVIDSAEKRAK
jgi:hypothetical protein